MRADGNPKDAVTAAIAEAQDADPEDPTDSEGDMSDSGDITADPADVPENDPIAARIITASTVAQFADITMESDGGPDPIAKLTQIARLRAGVEDVVASAPTETGSIPAATASTDDHPGWHIQLGAVPTAEGARALLNKAKASMGTELASLYPRDAGGR